MATATPKKTPAAQPAAPAKTAPASAAPRKPQPPKAAAPKKSAAKPAAAPKPKAAKPVAAPKADDKPAKPKKPKLVRDSFTIPKTEYVALDALKDRATRLARPAKKSEILRAGLMALTALPDAAYLAALNQVPAIKTGRPKKD